MPTTGGRATQVRGAELRPKAAQYRADRRSFSELSTAPTHQGEMRSGGYPVVFLHLDLN